MGGKVVFFLNAKGATGNIDMVAGDLVDGIVFAAFLKSRPDPKDFAERSEFLDRGDAARRRHAAANKVDQAVRDQRNHFEGMGKNFAHCLRGGADLADVAVVSNLLRGKDIFDEKHLVRLQPPRQLHGVHPAQVRVHVVQQLGGEACFVTQELEERRDRVHILLLVKRSPLVAALRRLPWPGGVNPPPP